jgi:hypothetical protein
MAEHAATVVASQPTDQPTVVERWQHRCEQGRWSDDARSCFATVQNEAELAGCRKLLTEGQAADLDAERRPAEAEAPKAMAAPPPAAEAPAKPASTTRGRPKPPPKAEDPDQGGE